MDYKGCLSCHQDPHILQAQGAGPVSISPKAIAKKIDRACARNVIFDASLSFDPDGEIVSYYWDFGDGENSGYISSEKTTHFYKAPGMYTVTLTVTDNDGKTGTDSFEIEIVNCPSPTQILPIKSLAENRIECGDVSIFELEKYITLSEERGIDVYRCKIYLEDAKDMIEKARKSFSKKNYITANNQILLANKEIWKAMDCLAKVLIDEINTLLETKPEKKDCQELLEMAEKEIEMARTYFEKNQCYKALDHFLKALDYLQRARECLKTFSAVT